MPSPPLILLVQLPIPPPGAEPVRGNVPLAAAYLKLFARRRGLETHYRIEILPPAIVNTRGDSGLVAEILARRPWMVGFTCYVWNLERTVWIAQRLKHSRPDLRVLVGGPEIVPDHPLLATSGGPVDYAAIGEGEQTFAELLEALRDGPTPPRPIPGLWTPVGGAPPARTPLADLDAVSSPYLEGILDAAEERLMMLETVRGCRYRCKYCYYPKNYDTLHFLSADQITANLRHAGDRGVEEVVLLDPTLNQRPDFADFLRLLARGNPGRQFTYSGELRAEGIDAATARLLRETNFKEVEIGLQSVAARAQRLMGRRVDLGAFERGAKAMLGEGISVRVDLILGLPGDTVASVRRGIEYLARVRPFSEVQVFNLSILPGTAFRRDARQLGLEYQSQPPYYVLRTPTLGVDDLRLLMDEAQAALGVEFDAVPEPQLGEKGDWPRLCAAPSGPFRQTGPVPFFPDGTGCRIDLDGDSTALPPAEDRAQVFTLWLRAADFARTIAKAETLIRRVLADNPHTTLQVVLEPTGDPGRLTVAMLDTLLAACHTSLSYLDWYYSLNPGGPRGAKRLVVLLPRSARQRLGEAWRDEIGQCATILWRGEKQAPPPTLVGGTSD